MVCSRQTSEWRVCLRMNWRKNRLRLRHHKPLKGGPGWRGSSRIKHSDSSGSLSRNGDELQRAVFQAQAIRWGIRALLPFAQGSRIMGLSAAHSLLASPAKPDQPARQPKYRAGQRLTKEHL